MLTSAYYYGMYVPYIFNKQQSRYSPVNRLAAADRQLPAAASFEKNNAVRMDMVDYARGIYNNVTEMRDAAKYLSQNAENYYMNVLNESFETARDWAYEDLSVFVNAYNNAVAFAVNQGHSRELTRYAEDMTAIAEEYKPALAEAGISLLENGAIMSFDRGKLSSAGGDYLELARVLAGAGEAAGQVYGRTASLMERPISDHMDFKQLSYYYNYSFNRYLSPSGQNRERPLPRLESGIILDKVI